MEQCSSSLGCRMRIKGKQEDPQVIHVMWLCRAFYTVFSLFLRDAHSKRPDPDPDTEVRSVLSKLGYRETNKQSLNTSLQGFGGGVV